MARIDNDDIYERDTIFTGDESLIGSDFDGDTKQYFLSDLRPYFQNAGTTVGDGDYGDIVVSSLGTVWRINSSNSPTANQILSWNGTQTEWIVGGGGDFLADGSIPMTGNFNGGGNNITNVTTGTFTTLVGNIVTVNDNLRITPDDTIGSTTGRHSFGFKTANRVYFQKLNETNELNLDFSALTQDRTVTFPDQDIDLGSIGGGVSDGDKGDITVSGSGTVWTIDNDTITNDNIVNTTINADSKIQASSITTGLIQNNAITTPKISPSATEGQVLTTVGGVTVWANATGGTVQTEGSTTVSTEGFSGPEETSTAYWVKTGRLVTVNVRMANMTGALDGTLRITGLPFAATDNSPNQQYIFPFVLDTGSLNQEPDHCRVVDTRIDLYFKSSFAAQPGTIAAGTLNGNGTFLTTLNYFTD